jgi:hypothetical protein
MIPHNGTYQRKRTLLQVQQFVHFAEINPNSFQSKTSKSKDDLISRTCSFGDFVLF